MNSSDFQKRAEYNQVGGWLLLFCISLTVIGPILTVRKFFLFYMQSDLKTAFDLYPGIKLLTTIDALASFSLVVFSIYAGVALWSYRKRAVIIAKVYLVTLFAFAILITLLPYALDITPFFRENIQENALKNLFRLSGYSILWFLYLTKSRRVKFTYGLNTKSDQSEKKP